MIAAWPQPRQRDRELLWRYRETQSCSPFPSWCPLPGSNDLNKFLKVIKWIPPSHSVLWESYCGTAIVLWEEKHVAYKTSDVYQKPQKCHCLNNTLFWFVFFFLKKVGKKSEKQLCQNMCNLWTSESLGREVSFTAQLQALDQQKRAKLQLLH